MYGSLRGIEIGSSVTIWYGMNWILVFPLGTFWVERNQDNVTTKGDNVEDTV